MRKDRSTARRFGPRTMGIAASLTAAAVGASLALASGRSAVTLTGVGEYVQFTLPLAANAVTMRYSTPDAPDGGGIIAQINVLANGKHVLTPILTSQ